MPCDGTETLKYIEILHSSWTCNISQLYKVVQCIRNPLKLPRNEAGKFCTTRICAEVRERQGKTEVPPVSEWDLSDSWLNCSKFSRGSGRCSVESLLGFRSAQVFGSCVLLFLGGVHLQNKIVAEFACALGSCSGGTIQLARASRGICYNAGRKRRGLNRANKRSDKERNSEEVEGTHGS